MEINSKFFAVILATSFDNAVDQAKNNGNGVLIKVSGSTGMPNSNNNWMGLMWVNTSATWGYVMCMGLGTSLYTRTLSNGTWGSWRTI